MADRKHVLIIDDIDDILDQSAHRLKIYASQKYEIKKFHYDLSSTYLNWIASGSHGPAPNWESLDSKLRETIESFCPDFVIMDWGYFITDIGSKDDPLRYKRNDQQANNLKRTARDLLFDPNTLGGYLSSRGASKLPDILIYTFNPFENSVFENLASLQDKFTEHYDGASNDRSAKPSLQYIETSAFFNKPRGLALYRGFSDRHAEKQLIGSQEELKEYGRLLAVIIREYLDERTGLNLFTRPGDKIFDIESLRFVRYTRFVSNKLGSVSYDEEKKVDLRLGAVSYYDAHNSILLDVPRKDYYGALDDWAKEDKFVKLLRPSDPVWTKSGRDYLYLRLKVKQSNKACLGNSSMAEILISEWYSNIDNHFQNNEKELTQLTSLLFSAVFHYCNENIPDVWAPNSDHVVVLSDSFRQRYDEEWIRNENVHTIDLFFLCQELDAGLDARGWINYTLYSEPSTSDVLCKEDVERIVNRILFDIRPAIIAKAKDALLPQLVGEVERHALNSAITQTAARNYAVTLRPTTNPPVLLNC
jgi:hypothetical protein